jgi:hypothetical protein
MLSLGTKFIVHSKDVTWLKQYHKDCSIKTNPVLDGASDDGNELIIHQKLNPNQDIQDTQATQEEKDGANEEVYLSCCVIENEAKSEITIMQSHLINSLINKFGDEVLEKRVFKSPGTPRFKIVSTDNKYKLIIADL